ncbi:hypothetical protein ACLI36_12295 [Pseudomonas aeruginosa]|uniref:hypothetical protein n=1 Tax=Pseudomonas aeruginosa TaxID=287 RepID=UPI001C0E011B|nr:hypothetical protein [Pseudomonas aeruginosa]MDU0797252.1 hypothetical protein [Pseudomonas aeruginosa]
MNKANECSCPSGDGSLVHPCPAHPAVEQAGANVGHGHVFPRADGVKMRCGGPGLCSECAADAYRARAALAQPSPAHPAPVEQAGGDERDFQAKGAQEVPSPVSKEYDRHLIGLLRKGEALPGHQEEAADEIERLRDWNDHLNNTVLPNILNPNFLMLMKGGERLLDLCTKDGKFIGVSLNDMKDVFDWMVTHARIAPDHAALAQPSGEVVVTKNESGAIVSVTRQDKEGRVLSVIAESATLTAQAEKAEVERPEVVAWQYRVTAGPQTGWSLWHPGKGEEFERSYTVERRPLMTVAQHERIVKAWIERWKAYIELSAKIAAQRDAANARLHEVATACATAEQERDAALAEVERLRESKGDPSGSFDRCMKMMYERDENAKRLDAALARVAELDKQCRDDVARALGLRPSQERGFAWSYLLASIKSCVKASEDAAQAQHSVPGDIMRDAQRYRWLRDQQFYFSFSTENSDAGISSCTAGMSSRFKNLSWVDAAIDSAIAAAPGKEVGHE